MLVQGTTLVLYHTCYWTGMGGTNFIPAKMDWEKTGAGSGRVFVVRIHLALDTHNIGVLGKHNLAGNYEIRL